MITKSDMKELRQALDAASEAILAAIEQVKAQAHVIEEQDAIQRKLVEAMKRAKIAINVGWPEYDITDAVEIIDDALTAAGAL